MSGSYPIPDTRFEATFRRALNREAENQRVAEWRKAGVVDPFVINQLQKNEPVKITGYTVCKVIVRDVMVMPLAQGFLWTTVLTMMRPWLASVVRNGRRLGSFIYKTILGTDLIKQKRP